jgi:hypothetical protein
MATSEKGTTRKGRGRAAAAQQGAPELEGRQAPGKVMAAFRIPRHLHATMTQESRAEGLDLTAYVNRLFDGFLHHFGLPSIIRENLERDREALGLSRYEYLQYVLYRRHEAVTEKGEGFDRGPAKRR